MPKQPKKADEKSSPPAVVPPCRASCRAAELVPLALAVKAARQAETAKPAAYDTIMHGGLSRSANSEGGEVFGHLRRFVRSQNLRIFAHF